MFLFPEHLRESSRSPSGLSLPVSEAAFLISLQKSGASSFIRHLLLRVRKTEGWDGCSLAFKALSELGFVIPLILDGEH